MNNVNLKGEKIFLILAAIFISSLVACNLIFQKFFVLDLSQTVFVLSVGILPYPITFLVTDIISEIYGKKKANAVNYEGVKNVSEAAKLNDASLIHFSTDYVFDGKKKSPYLETDKANPINEYGLSKLRGENHILSNIENFFIFRVSGIFSEYGDNFVKSMMRLKDKDELAVVNDQIMKPSSATFIANFLKINLLKNNFALSNAGLYNLSASGPQISWHNFAEIIFKEMLAQKLIIKIPRITPILSKDYKSSVLRPEFSVLSNNKVKEKFILDNANFKENLKIEIKRIYQAL